MKPLGKDLWNCLIWVDSWEVGEFGNKGISTSIPNNWKDIKKYWNTDWLWLWYILCLLGNIPLPSSCGRVVFLCPADIRLGCNLFWPVEYDICGISPTWAKFLNVTALVQLLAFLWKNKEIAYLTPGLEQSHSQAAVYMELKEEINICCFKLVRFCSDSYAA